MQPRVMPRVAKEAVGKVVQSYVDDGAVSVSVERKSETIWTVTAKMVKTDDE